jgi:serine protease Do
MTPITKISRRPAAKTLAALLLSTTLLAGGVTAGHAWSAEQTAPPAATGRAGYLPGFGDLVAKVKPAVVNIATTEAPPDGQNGPVPSMVPPNSPLAQMFRHYSERQHQSARHALGSGFIVDPAGYIVTNNHVVDGATKIMVTLDDGSIFPAKVIGRDAKTDVALLKIDAGKQLPAVGFGQSAQARVGDWVIAVGNPFGLGGSVTAGIISAHGRNLDAGPYDNFLQIDAPINPGNSGGPLFDQSGHVIGIDTAIYSPNGGSVGIGFALPSDLAANVVAQLREHGTVERGWLGVEMQPLTPALAKAVGLDSTKGVMVDQVEPHSPAAASIRQGDVITQFDGKEIATARALAMAVADTHAGQSAKLGIWRDGKQQTVEVAIGRQPDQKQAASEQKDGQDGALGLGLKPLSPGLRDELGLDADTTGVLVAQLRPDGTAAESGVQPGDVIVRVGSDPVTSPAEFAAKIHAAETAKKAAVPLLVMRDGTSYYVALQLAKG